MGIVSHQIQSFGNGEVDIPPHFVMACSLNVTYTELAFDNSPGWLSGRVRLETTELLGEIAFLAANDVRTAT